MNWDWWNGSGYFLSSAAQQQQAQLQATKQQQMQMYMAIRAAKPGSVIDVPTVPYFTNNTTIRCEYCGRVRSIAATCEGCGAPR